MLNSAETLAVCALIISVGSLGVSTYVAFRDSPKLKVTSKFISASEYGPNRVVATMINVGRRPVILRLIGGCDTHNALCGTYIEHATGGKRLGERERYEHTFTKEDIVSFHPDGEDFFIDEFCVEDSLGVRHLIPNSREHIRLLGL